MANLRIDPDFCNRILVALLLGGAVYGGSLLFAQPAPELAAEEQVVEVRIEGNLTVPREKILTHIRTRAGRPFDSEVIEGDVRRLTRTRMFVNVETFTQKVHGGRVVIFQVLERPTLQEVKYVGNRKIKDKVLSKEVELEAGDALDPFAVEEARRKLEDFYHGKGFSKARVTVVEGNKARDRRAVFLINEGPKQRVLSTSFIGNTIASDARLRTQIKSKPGIFWYFKGEVDRKQIDEDVNRLTAYYRSLGFFRARVGRELEFNAGQDWLHLTFVIDEGPRYTIRNVSFLGNKRFSSAELASKLTLKDGQYFNQAQMTKDVAAIREAYGSDGYAFADVQADPRYLEEPGMLDLVYRVDEGDRFRVGRINVEIKGENPHTRVTTVLNRLSLKPGDIVDIRKLRESERRLRRSGLFLIDPSSGAAPKIVFSPPQLEEAETEIARPPRRGSKARGQSPDLVPCGPWRWKPAANSSPGDRRVNLTLPCRRIDANIPRRSEPPPRYGPQPGRNPPAARTPAMVVRGQNGYSAEGGWSTPRLRPGTPSLPHRQPQLNTVGRPPAANDLPYWPQAATPAAAPANANPSPLGPQPGFQPGPQLPAPGVAAAPPQLPVSEGIFSEDSPFREGLPDEDPARLLDLGVVAEETQTGRMMFGVGINSSAGLVGSIVYDEQNFDWTRFPRSWEDIRNATAWRGAGQRLRVEAIPGTLVQRYMVNFQEPYLFDTAVSLGLSGFFYDRWYDEWTEQRLGARVSWGYQFTHDLSGTFAFRGAKVNISRPLTTGVTELDDALGDSALYGFRFQLAHDTRDSAFLATEGHLFQVAFEQVVGSFDYPRAEVDLQRYFLIHERPDGSGRHVLSLSGRFGWTGEQTPIYDHYFVGGFSTLRGFDFRDASPRDAATGVLVGGHFMLLASIQYLFPITADDMLRAVVFCDTGAVEPTIDDWSDKYRIAPGFGLRITIPAMGPAPIALDFAFPISAEPTDQEEVFSFFVGFNR